MGYRWLEHTADLRLLAYGRDEAALYQEAGTGLLEAMGAPGKGAGLHRAVTVVAPDRESLMVAWLNELIYLAAVAGGPPAWCEVVAVQQRAEFELTGRVGPASPATGAEVKAATYHGLRVSAPGEEAAAGAVRPAGVPPGNWWAEIIVDV
ncbi:MAG TPA: archease [Bacillota bacterium]|nr:archease [Bacillota bacterium]